MAILPDNSSFKAGKMSERARFIKLGLTDTLETIVMKYNTNLQQAHKTYDAIYADVVADIEKSNDSIRMFVKEKVDGEEYARKAEIAIERGRITGVVEDLSEETRQRIASVSIQADRIDSVVSDVETISGAVDTVSGNLATEICERQSAISQQADRISAVVSDVSTVSTGLATERTERQSAITQTAQAIQTEVTARSALGETVSKMKQGPSGFEWSVASTQNVATAKSEAISAAAGDATSKANAAQTAAINAAASDATNKANNAAKTATNYMSFDSTNGLLIGNKTSGSWSGYRAQITGSGMNVLNASGTVVANYGSTCRVGPASGGNTYISGTEVYTYYNGQALTGAWAPYKISTANNDWTRLEVFGPSAQTNMYMCTSADDKRCGLWRGGSSPVRMIAYDYDAGSALILGDAQAGPIRPQIRIVPQTNNSLVCGNSVYKWSEVWAGSFQGASSRRFKENIQDMTEDEAKKILDINAVTFDYKESEGGAKDQRGVIAEDVIDIIPSVVALDDLGLPAGVDYSKFVPYLIKICQMQEERIKSLEAKVPRGIEIV